MVKIRFIFQGAVKVKESVYTLTKMNLFCCSGQVSTTPHEQQYSRLSTEAISSGAQINMYVRTSSNSNSYDHAGNYTLSPMAILPSKGK